MATRCGIFLETENGFKGCGVHFDGYLSCVGFKLLFNYGLAETKELVQRSGHYSALRDTPEETLSEIVDNTKTIEVKDPLEFANNTDWEFVYVLDKNGEWFFSKLEETEDERKFKRLRVLK